MHVHVCLYGCAQLGVISHVGTPGELRSVCIIPNLADNEKLIPVTFLDEIRHALPNYLFILVVRRTVYEPVAFCYSRPGSQTTCLAFTVTVSDDWRWHNGSVCIANTQHRMTDPFNCKLQDLDLH